MTCNPWCGALLLCVWGGGGDLFFCAACSNSSSGGGGGGGDGRGAIFCASWCSTALFELDMRTMCVKALLRFRDVALP